MIFRILLLILLLPAVTIATPIVNNVGTSPEDSIAVTVFCTDSIGNPIAADSFFVLVVGPSGDSIFSESITTSSSRLDSTLMSGFVLYRYRAAVADIDRSGIPGAYSLSMTVKHNSPLLYNTFRHSFQITGWELHALSDSAGIAARAGEDALDSLASVLDSLYAVLDSLQAGVRVASLDASAASDVWDVPFTHAFDDGSLGDSLTTATFVQGQGANLDSATLVGWIWNTPQDNHTIDGTFGDNLDAAVSGIGSGSGLYSVTLTVFDESHEQVVPHTSIAIRNSEQTALIAVANTGIHGTASFSLDAGEYTVAAAAPGFVFDGLTTIEVSGAIDDTLLADAFDPGQPAAPLLCRVFGYVRAVDALPVEGAKVSAELSGSAFFSTIVVAPQSVSVTTDANGYFYFDLMPSDLLTPLGTPYDISISYNGRTFVRQQVTIPSTATWQLTW